MYNIEIVVTSQVIVVSDKNKTDLNTVCSEFVFKKDNHEIFIILISEIISKYQIRMSVVLIEIINLITLFTFIKKNLMILSGFTIIDYI